MEKVDILFWIVAGETILLTIFIRHFQLFKLKTDTKIMEVKDQIADVDSRLSSDFAQLKTIVDGLKGDPNVDKLSPASQTHLNNLSALADAMGTYLNPPATTTGGPTTNTGAADQSAQQQA